MIHDLELEARLPRAYADLARYPGPAVLREGLALYGVHEYPGGADNPEILRWRDALRDEQRGLEWLDTVFTGDHVPWCGLYMAICALRAGHRPVHPDFLAARSWVRFGAPRAVNEAGVGDVLVFWRGDPGGRSGHVGFYVGEDRTHFHVLGGNQSDSVNIQRIPRTRLLSDGVRRPPLLDGRHPGWGWPVVRSPRMARVSTGES